MYDSNGNSHLIARFTSFIEMVIRNARVDIIRQKQRYNMLIFSHPAYYQAVEDFDLIYERELPPPTDFNFGSASLEMAFRSLKDKPQQVLRLSFVHGLDEGEIAEVLGCRREYVKKIRYRALQRLRQLIERGEIEL